MAFGEKIGDESSRTTSRRILPSQGGPRMEISGESTGRILGVEYKGYFTYNAVVRADGFLQGDGLGVFMTKDGESIAWTGYGVGKFMPRGGVSWRGMFFYQTVSSKLARLNSTPAAFEYEIDEKGDGKGSFTEWK
jgi:hypothetical protein